MEYEKSPCYYCALDRKDKQRRNDSRESGHGRVASLEVLERYLSDELPQEDGGAGEDQQTSEHDLVLDFIGAFCRMDIRTQYLVEQRAFHGQPLDAIADSYRRTFSRPMTASGILATAESAKSRIASALRPAPTKA